MHLTIHTLPIIRNEIRTYKSLIKERDKLINDYEAPLKTLRNKLLEVEEKLELIKSPGKGDGLGGFVQDSADKYNYLIDKKDQLKKSIVDYIQSNEKDYLEDLKHWDVRIATVEYYLNKMDALDRKFIEDFYYNLSKTQCLQRYNIVNNKSLYRKADNILLNLLKKIKKVLLCGRFPLYLVLLCYCEVFKKMTSTMSTLCLEFIYD